MLLHCDTFITIKYDACRTLFEFIWNQMNQQAFCGRVDAFPASTMQDTIEILGHLFLWRRVMVILSRFAVPTGLFFE